MKETQARQTRSKSRKTVTPAAQSATVTWALFHSNKQIYYSTWSWCNWTLKQLKSNYIFNEQYTTNWYNEKHEVSGALEWFRMVVNRYLIVII